ncbi:MAG: Ig-like domain-containing protein, partial [Nitrospira sp.]
MSLAELFYAKHPRRTWFSRLRKSSGKGPRSVTPPPSGIERAFRLELLEPRVLLSATPTEVVAPQEVVTAALTGPANALANLDVDLNGQADALSDGILMIRHLFGFTGSALTTGAVDPAGQRTDPAAISSYLDQFRTTMLDVDLNGRADALTDGILIIRNLFGFTGSALTDGAVDLAGTRTNAAAISAFLNNMNPAVELIGPAVTPGLASDTGLSATDRITFNATITGSISDLNSIASFRAGLDATPPVAFTDILADLSATGTFSLTTARLNQLSGGTLSDGTHTLHLQATDSRGNTTLTDFTFTLDRQAPGIAGVGLSAGSDTGTVGDNSTSAAKVVITGSTEAGAAVTLGSTNVLAPGTGAFQIPDVALVSGANLFSLTSTDLAGNASQASLTITRAGVATADVALAWNQLTLEAIRLSVTDPPIATRILAMVSLAQYDTLAAIEQSPAYLIQQSVSGPVSVDAALAKAAHTVLYDLFPAQRATFDAALNALLAGIADGAAKTNALTLGQAIGQGILAVRANDGSGTFLDYPGGSQLGQWQPTAPMFDVADQPQWGDLTPFALTSGDQFRPAAPPALDSAAYAASVEEVRLLGSATSATRTADQTQQAQFWADGKGSYTPPGHWDLIAAQIAQQQGNSLSANVRLFAQLNVALADAAIAAWDAKYTYGLWRPI